MGCSLALADIRITQGRLGEALRTYEQALGLAQEEHASVLRGMVDMHAGMSELYRERDDLAAAARHLLACQELGEHNGLPQHPYRWRVALARVEEAQGNLAGALDLLDEAERRYVSDFFPNVRPVPALKARVWIAQGRLGDALGWAREQGLSADDDLRADHQVTVLAAGFVPVAAWEFSLGLWLVVKGFRPSPITAALDAADATLTVV